MENSQVALEASAADAAEILDALKDSGWSNTTIQTFLARLVKKGAVKTERQGTGYLYTPLVSEEECQHSEARACLQRVFEKLAASFSNRAGAGETV